MTRRLLPPPNGADSPMIRIRPEALENAYEGVPVKAPTLPPLGSFLPANQPSVTRL